MKKKNRPGNPDRFIILCSFIFGYYLGGEIHLIAFSQG